MYSLAVKNRTTQFLKDYGKGIAQAIRGTGLFFPAVVALKALESGWGTSGLTKEANNFGGIKYNPNIQGVVGFVVKDTIEFKKGCRCVTKNCKECQYKSKEKFSKFKDVESGVRATIKVLLSDRYAKARTDAKTPEEQILMFARAKYTTTPPEIYLSNLQPIIEATQDLTGLGRIS